MLKNTYKFHQRGAEAEASVQSYFLSRGWSISSQRTKFDGVEVDLIVEKANRRVLLEVKYLDHSWRAFERVGTKQIQRLKYVLLGMRKKSGQLKVEGYVVFVLNDRKLHFISLDEVV
ncbi:MAG: YraN family protein [Bdellovibrionota bacterium]